MAATITLNVVTKDKKALDYLNQLSQKKGELEKPITVNLNVDNIKKATEYTGKLAEAWSRITSTVARRAINETYTAISRSFKDALGTMKAVDTELTNIQKVSGKTSEEIKAIGDRAYETATKFGVAADEYLSAVYTFQKAGLNKNTEELAELATKTMLVGDTTAAVASKFLIAANAAWNYQGDIQKLSEIVDEADWINNNYATDLQKLSQGLPIVASVASQAGLSAEQTMAALGTIQSVTQETGTKSATAFRALILNILGETGEFVTEEGEAFEVTEESVKNLHYVMEKYAGDAIAKAKESGGIIDVLEVIRALAKASEDELSKAEIFQILSGLGGKLRTNQLTALVENTEMLDKILGELGESAGTADKEIKLMMGSWEKKAQNLKTQWTKFVAGLVSTDEIKGLVDDVTSFVANLDPEKIGTAIRDVLYPIIDFIKNTDWAGFAKSFSEIFDKIAAFAGAGIALGVLTSLYDALEKILKALSRIGAMLGVGTALGAKGATASGVATAGAAGAGIIGGLLLLAGTIYNIVDPAVKAQRQIDELTESARKLGAVTNDSDKKYQNQISSLTATRGVLDVYLDRLDGLTEGTDEYNNVLKAMVQLIPELGDIIDTTTGHIEGGKKAIEEYADSWYKAAEAAVYQAMYTEIASEKIRAELERNTTQKKLDDLYENYAGLDVYTDLLVKRQEYEAKNYMGVLSEAERVAYAALEEQIGQMENVAGFKEARAEAARLEIALDTYDERIDEAKDKLDELAESYGAKLEEEAPKGRSEDYVSPADAWRAKEEAAKRAASATQETTSATQEATQAENEYAEAATNSGSAATQAATLTATAVREDTVPALKEVKEALDAIPEERGITLTPHFENALAAIQRYVHFLDYLKENYSSTLTSTITHDDKTNNRFYQETASGANGIPARATGDSNFPGGPTLVNELGPELISENGRAFIAGGGKPTVVNLAPGAIVIPADETRQALKGGMPRYGRAYAFIGNGTNQSGNPPIGAITTPSGILNQYRKAKAMVTIETGGGGKGGGGTSSRGGSGSSSASNTITFNFPDLEKQLSDALKLLEAQVELAENEGDYPRMAELYEKAQESIKDLVDKYRQAGYSDDSIEVLTLLNKNYDYANKQLKLYQDKWDDLIDALSADTDATKAAKELEEKRLALEEATAAYENAQKQRTVRMYNASTGQWEWIADDKKVQSARDKVSSAEENYADTVKKQAIAELERMKETVTDLSDVVLGPALSAVATMAESSDEFQNFARALNAVFGVGSFLQSTEGTTKAISTVDSHDTTYSFGGVDISPEQASTMSLKDLAQMLQVLKIT